VQCDQIKIEYKEVGKEIKIENKGREDKTQLERRLEWKTRGDVS
jgi:hypothetical protein